MITQFCSLNTFCCLQLKKICQEEEYLCPSKSSFGAAREDVNIPFTLGCVALQAVKIGKKDGFDPEVVDLIFFKSRWTLK